LAEKRPLVVDTSVSLKFYLPEEGHEEAVRLLEAEESGAAKLLAPGTILPEGFNAIVWQRKRGLLDAEDTDEAWGGHSTQTGFLYCENVSDGGPPSWLDPNSVGP
jgi:predicted nucleic acid-binding protein